MPKKKMGEEPDPKSKPDSTDPEPGAPPRREPLVMKPEGDKTKERLSFAVNAEGKIDYDSMRTETKQRFIEVIKNSPIPGVEIKRDPPFSEETLRILWGSLGYAEAGLLGGLWLKAPKEIAMQVFPYNEDQQKSLSEALNKCLVKYEWLNSVKYKEEMDLIGMYGMMLAMKILACKQMVEEWKKTESAKQPQPEKIQ